MLEDGPFSGLEPPPTKRTHSSASSPRLYNVFINHRGSDVKETVALPLYKSLRRMGFQVFLDSEEIQLGDYFPSALQNAILSASVHIAIFSKGYAKSPWCLAELVLMLESDAKIIPVFSGVRPSDLRYSQKGVYFDAFVGYQRKGRHLGKLEKWKEALHTVSFINGYEFSKNNDDVDDMCEKIVSAVLKELDNTKSLNVAKHAVGLEKAKTAFTTKKDFGKEEPEAQWAHAQRTLHGIHSSETNLLDKISYQELSEISEEAKRRSQFGRLTELHTLKGHVEAVLKLKGLDIKTIQHAYSL